MRLVVLLISCFVTHSMAGSSVTEGVSLIQRLEGLNCPDALEEIAGFLTSQRGFFESLNGEATPEMTQDLATLNEAFSQTRRTLQDCVVKLEGDRDRSYAKALIDALVSAGTVSGALEFWLENQSTRTPSPDVVLEKLGDLLDSVRQSVELSGT